MLWHKKEISLKKKFPERFFRIEEQKRKFTIES